MYVLINNDDGTYYTSAAFAYYRDKSVDEHGQKVPEAWRYYYLVLNKEKTAVVKKYIYDRNDYVYFRKMVLCLDDSEEGWSFKEDGTGEINTHEKAALLAMERNGVGFVTQDLIEEDRKYSFNDIQEIRTQFDANRLNTLSWGFHDAYVDEIEANADTLRILLKGVWGCNVEIWFVGDVQYDMSFRSDPRYSPYWDSGYVWLENGFIYLADEYEADVNKITKDTCWFRARSAKYTLHLK